MSEFITPLVVGALTLMAWSLLYRENVFYRVAEVLMVGFGMGYTLYISLSTLNRIWLQPLIQGKFWLIIPAILGLLLYTIYSKKYLFLSRWAMAAIAGAGSGYAVSRAIPVMIIGQIMGLGVKFSELSAMDLVNHIIAAISCIATVSYFTFTIEHRGWMGGLARIGRWSMMLAFGSTFGATLYANQIFTIERAAFLAKYPQNVLLIIAVLLIVFDVYKRRKS
ncbi:MAG: hypothetical protein QXI93_05515 [Candidatus Methanomethylicia archaeon]